MKRSRCTLSVRSVFAIGFAGVIVAAIIGGIALLDSPAEERLHRLDERRVADLRELAYALDSYWTREGALPSSLDELPDEHDYLGELVDPESGEPYEYRVLGEDTYELCAVFATETTEQFETPFQDSWFHGAGRQCFELKAQDPERPLGR